MSVQRPNVNTQFRHEKALFPLLQLKLWFFIQFRHLLNLNLLRPVAHTHEYTLKLQQHKTLVTIP